MCITISLLLCEHFSLVCFIVAARIIAVVFRLLQSGIVRALFLRSLLAGDIVELLVKCVVGGCFLCVYLRVELPQLREFFRREACRRA